MMITKSDLKTYPFTSTMFADGEEGYHLQVRENKLLGVVWTAEKPSKTQEWQTTFTWRENSYDSVDALIAAMNEAGFELPVEKEDD